MTSTADAAPPPAPQFVPLVLINLFGHVALSGGRVTTSLYALQGGASESFVGLLIAVYGVLPMFFALAMGRWIDRIGPAAPMRLGIVAVFVGVALPVVVPGVPTLFGTAVLCGLGFNMVSLAAQVSVGNLHRASPADRIKGFGWLSVGHSTSSVGGPLLVGVLIDAIDHHAAFAAVAASAGIACALVFRCAAHLPAPSRTSPGPAHGGSAWQLVADPAMRRIYVIGVLLAVGWDMFTFLMPIVGHRQQLSASTIGMILSVFAAGTFSVRLAMSRIARRMTEWQVLRTAIVVIVAVYVVLPLLHTVPLFFAIAFVLGAAVGCSQPNMLSLLHDASPPERAAEAVGLRSLFGNASGVLVPLLVGATAASVGVAPVLWGVALLIATALPAAHRASRS